jgi:hypothetical protein
VIARCNRGYGFFDLELVRNIALTSLPTGSDRSADGFIQSSPLSRAAALPDIAWVDSRWSIGLRQKQLRKIVANIGLERPGSVGGVRALVGEAEPSDHDNKVR